MTYSGIGLLTCTLFICRNNYFIVTIVLEMRSIVQQKCFVTFSFTCHANEIMSNFEKNHLKNNFMHTDSAKDNIKYQRRAVRFFFFFFAKTLATSKTCFNASFFTFSRRRRKNKSFSVSFCLSLSPLFCRCRYFCVHRKPINEIG